MSEPPKGDERDRFERELTTDLKDTTPDRPRGLPLHSRILIGLAVGVAAGLAANAIFGGESPGVAWVIANLTEPVGTLFLRAPADDRGAAGSPRPWS